MNSHPSDHPHLWQELWDLEARYWADVDLAQGAGAADFYTQDAVFDMGIGDGTRYLGRDAIRSFYDKRRESNRTTLHVMNNFAVEDSSRELAQSRVYMSLYFSLGSAPQDSALPSMMSVLRTRYSLDGGQWLISERSNQLMFAEPGYRPPS